MLKNDFASDGAPNLFERLRASRHEFNAVGCYLIRPDKSRVRSLYSPLRALDFPAIIRFVHCDDELIWAAYITLLFPLGNPIVSAIEMASIPIDSKIPQKK